MLSKTVKDRRVGGCHDFLSKLFCPIVPKNFRRGTLLWCVPEKFQYRKLFEKQVEGSENGEIPSNFCCLTAPKRSVEEPFCAVFQRTSSSEKSLGVKEREG